MGTRRRGGHDRELVRCLDNHHKVSAGNPSCGTAGKGKEESPEIPGR